MLDQVGQIAGPSRAWLDGVGGAELGCGWTSQKKQFSFPQLNLKNKLQRNQIAISGQSNGVKSTGNRVPTEAGGATSDAAYITVYYYQ